MSRLISVIGLVRSVLAVIAMFALVHIASAQTSNGAWRLRGNVDYGSAEEACAQAFKNDVPADAGSEFFGVRTYRKNLAECDWLNRTEYGYGPRVTLPTGAIFSCDPGERTIGTEGNLSCTSSNDDICEDGLCVGNPIFPKNGAKLERHVDFASPDGRFKIERLFTSIPSNVSARSGPNPLGPGWRFAHDVRINVSNVSSISNWRVDLDMAGRMGLKYTAASSSGSLPVTRGPEKESNAEFKSFGNRLSLVDYDRSTSSVRNADRTWALDGHDGSRYTFFNSQLLTKVAADGYTQSFTYDDDGALIGMSDNLGRTAVFKWHKDQLGYDNGDGTFDPLIKNGQPVEETPRRIKSVSLYDGTEISYGYDVSPKHPDIRLSYQKRFNRLTSFARTKPGAAAILDSGTYEYEGDRFPLLTFASSGNGAKTTTVEYDDRQRATRSSHSGGDDSVDVEYTSYTARKITHASGRVDTLDYGRWTSRRFRGISSIATAASAGAPADVRSFQYGRPSGLDSMSYGMTQTTDRNGRVTKFERDTRGYLTKLIKGSGSADEVIIEIDRLADRRHLVSETREPGLTTSYEYDPLGRTTKVTQTDTSASPSPDRVWNFGYDTHPFLPSSVDGPLPGNADTTAYTYSGDTLVSVTNALGHETTFSDFTTAGLPQHMTDPNGVVTTMGYDAKNRLTTMIEDSGGLAATTTLSYNGSDYPTAVAFPNGSRLDIGWTASQRLSSLKNSLGERIEFSYSPGGGITETRTLSASGEAETIVSQLLDVRDRVNAITAGPTTATPLSYEFDLDGEGNVEVLRDGRMNEWTSKFDSLNRRYRETDPDGKLLQWRRNDVDPSKAYVNQVTDQEDVSTYYTRNGWGEIVAELSVEAGSTSYVRDDRGLVTQMTDARGVVTSYSYDLLGRLTAQAYSGSPQDDASYVYDEGSFGIGQLTTLTEGYGTTSYAYNALGFRTSETRTIEGQSYTTAFAHSLSGDVTSITYPSGRVLALTRDSEAQITGLTFDGTAIVTNIGYEAFSSINSASFADGRTLTIDYDTSGRAKRFSRLGGPEALMDIAFTYDPSGNISALTDAVRPAKSQTFTYDALSRVTSAENAQDGGYGRIDYTWNGRGDRLSRTVEADGESAMESYIYDAATARLTDVEDVAGVTLRQLGYAPSGQATSDTRASGETYLYALNARGRLATVSRTADSTPASDVARYTYDVDGQRVAKNLLGSAATDAPAPTLHFLYDHQGRLMAEMDGETGATLREYAWLGWTPVMVRSTSTTDLPETCDPDLVTQVHAQLATIRNNLDAREDALSAVQASLSDRRAVRDTRTATLASLLNSLGDRMSARDLRLERQANLVVARDRLIASGNDPDRLAEIEARLDELATLLAADAEAITRLEGRADELETAIAALDTRIAELVTRETDLTALIATLREREQTVSDRLTRLESRCATDGAPTTVATTYLLHADHLGRPEFATRLDGSTAWRAGRVTPFGQRLDAGLDAGITTAGALSQQLLFPGQYEDAETGQTGTWLAHNHNRSYDPVLGRYLQSDPIGLEGGINRYAYVGGNPTGWVDPRGLQGLPGILPKYNAKIFQAAHMPRYIHLNRNMFQRDIPCTKEEAIALGWWLYPEGMDSFHEGGDPRIDKFGYDRSEAIYNADGTLNRDPKLGPSYNFVEPIPGADWLGPLQGLDPRYFHRNVIGHGLLDVLPATKWGNGPLMLPNCGCQ